MSDEEFDQIMAKKEVGIESSKALESRIEQKWLQFSEDYDLTDLKINDREVLRGLIQAIISLEDYEQMMFRIRAEGMTVENLTVIDKIQKAMSDLRKGISDSQNDLNITRKVRKSDQESSVIAYIDGLKEKAKNFYESRMNYIFCPKCNTLLATIWVLYADQERNKVSLVCNRENHDGILCGEKVIVSIKDLIESRNTNKKEIVPDSIV
jgi:hypothetical protein